MAPRKASIAPRTSTTPIDYPKTIRHHDVINLTSLPAGKMVPILAVPLLREDSARMQIGFSVQMMETVELIMNEINVNVKAYFVPHLAFERFQGMDDFNRSWEGQPPRPGLPVVPFIEQIPAKGVGLDPILKYLGKHARPGSLINTAYHEAYNMIWNFRAKNRSKDITERARLDDTLAPAFWHHERFAHIVPDFDQAVMDGNVALNVINSKMPVKGFGLYSRAATTGFTVTTTGGSDENFNGWAITTPAATPGTGQAKLAIKSSAGGNPDVWAELQQNGITVSLANIDLARKTQAFAKLREQFAGHDDDYIMDMLMDGITLPEQAWRQPILLSQQDTIFGMTKRYATDGGSLTDSVVNGATMLSMNFAVPQCGVGGVIMVVAEVTPGQLFERGRDPFLHAENPNSFPHALKDTLDPEPVEVVRNEYIDIDHDAPAGVFGYGPLNHQWNFASPTIGGRFYRPEVDAPFDEDRQRIWAVETQNPVLSEDFYIVKAIHTKPFVNPGQDPFELVSRGTAAITGITQFGPLLIEATNNYAEVMAEAPVARIVKA